MDDETELKMCSKFKAPENYIKAFAPIKDGSKSDDIETNETLDDQLANTLNSVTSNYIIVKQILQGLCWQDIRLASAVSKLWYEVARNICKHDLTPEHFCFVDVQNDKVISYKIDKRPKVGPMLMLAFLRRKTVSYGYPLSYFSVYGSYNTNERFKMLDYVNIKLSYPSNALVGVTCDLVMFPTIKSGCKKTTDVYIGGMYIPQIHGVKVHKLRQVINDGEIMVNHNTICDRLIEIMETEHIKCLLIFPPKHFDGSHDCIVEKIIADVEARQGEEYPFAVGGCIVYGTQVADFNGNPSTEELVVVAIGTDKSIPDSSLNFEVFSMVTAKERDNKRKMAANIAQMSESIPRREYSAAIKLSCSGRTDTHKFELAAFTRHFPDTKTAGCFGNGEIGLDRLPRNISKGDDKDDGDTGAEKKTISKKPRINTPRKHELFYSFSSVMVYFSWGNLK